MSDKEWRYVVGQAPEDVPPICPITGLPFFSMEYAQFEPDKLVPTYGGPFDSYTIPERDEDGGWDRQRFDHDAGGWVEGYESFGDTDAKIADTVCSLIQRGFKPAKSQEPRTLFFQDAMGSATIHLKTGLVEIWQNTDSAPALLSSSSGGITFEEAEALRWASGYAKHAAENCSMQTYQDQYQGYHDALIGLLARLQQKGEPCTPSTVSPHSGILVTCNSLPKATRVRGEVMGQTVRDVLKVPDTHDLWLKNMDGDDTLVEPHKFHRLNDGNSYYTAPKIIVGG